jgi:hypothetical protein
MDLNWEEDCPGLRQTYTAVSLPWNDWVFPVSVPNVTEAQLTDAWSYYWLDILRGLQDLTPRTEAPSPLEVVDLLGKAQVAQMDLFTSSMPRNVYSSLIKLPELSIFFRKGGFDIRTCSTYVCPDTGGPGSPPPDPIPIIHRTGMFYFCRAERLRG